MFFLALLFVVSSAAPSRHLQSVHQVIIIGAGAAGIGASYQLTSRNVQHIILEARNRLGGRIMQGTSSGVNIDLGASFVHNPSSSNVINTIINQLGVGKTLANFNAADELFQTGSTTPNSTTVNTLYSQLTTFIDSRVASGDVSLQTCWNEFQPTVTGTYSAQVRNKVYYKLYLEASLNGAQLSELSAKAFSTNTERGTGDYLPNGGYVSLLTRIHQQLCKSSTIIYNKVVTQIDYSGTTVRVTTSAGDVYEAKKVICTLPLGVLKASTVTFTPSLPSSYQTAIGNMGFGVFNKVVAFLNDTFWTSGNSVVDFIANSGQPFTFPEAYVVPDATHKILMFFVSGSTSTTLNAQTDSQIITNLTNTLANFINIGDYSITSYLITRWEQDPYAKGSYSFYKVGNTKADYQQLMVPIDSKLYLAGEHVHPNMSSNVHGAFQSGMWAAQKASPSGQLFYFFHCGLGFILLWLLL